MGVSSEGQGLSLPLPFPVFRGFPILGTSFTWALAWEMVFQRAVRLMVKGMTLMNRPFYAALGHRTVLRSFVSKEILGRYAGSFAGLFWIVLEPLASIVVYSFLFTAVFRVRLDPATAGTDSFTLYFLAAYFPWLIFSDTVVRAAASVLGNAGLVSKVIFPVELLPLSSVLSSFLTHGVGFFLYLVFMLWKGYASSSWLFFPLLLMFLFLLSCGMAFFVSALTVFVRDVQHSLSVFLMVWFYATPVLYPVSFVPESIQSYLWLNPMTYTVSCFRDVLLGATFRWEIFSGLALSALVLYSVGVWFFSRSKRAFADVL